MSTLVFSICARNYIGLARVLGSSLSSQDDAPDFRIYVAEGLDETVAGDDLVSAPESLSHIISDAEWRNMAFQYNITEFCTAIKAACLMHAFSQGYDKVVYLDPDTFVAGDFKEISGALDGCEILITPHLCIPAMDQGPRSDQGILATGVYNLGFIGLRRGAASREFLAWWHERLRHRAFNDHYSSLFTDQRWIDFVPSLFEASSVRVWRHLGCNLAPWNFHERRVETSAHGMQVVPRAADQAAGWRDSLVFIHFSGFDFRKILAGEFDQRNLAGSQAPPDLDPVFTSYAHAIASRKGDFERHLAIPYGYASYADGTAVLPSHRRLFRVWRERHGDAEDPFAVGAQTFHEALKTRKLLARSSAADLYADNASIRSIANPEGLARRAHQVFKGLFRVLGRSRFFVLVRSLNRFARVEQQYDTFQLDRARVRSASITPREPTCPN